jgi:hypothetical protein
MEYKGRDIIKQDKRFKKHEIQGIITAY